LCGPHAQSTCRFFIESKQAYHANPYLFLNGQENNFVSHDILSRNLGVCNESFSFESNHVIPDHETLFDAFPFDDTLFKTHFEQDHVLSDETLLEDKSHVKKTILTYITLLLISFFLMIILKKVRKRIQGMM
jgi:hypothetical protein